mmetsp:Transcript_27509/g.30635  ORF Transcript_27509/g.30635 Transcript_27509/m.30635 type:complete len:150 (+) Transcript_27509:207-656(+)
MEDIYRKVMKVDEAELFLNIFDTAGRIQDYSVQRDHFIGKRDGFVLVYSITNRESFEFVVPYFEEFHEARGKTIPILLIGNKSDREDDRKVSTKEGQELADHYGCMFFETSAKDNTNIDESFHTILHAILELKKVQIPLDKKQSKSRMQ